MGATGLSELLGIILALLLALIVVLVFCPVLRHGFVESWDDDIAITHNPDYNPPRLGNLAHYWVPPPRLEFFVPVTYSIWGFLAMTSRGAEGTLDPIWFHAANLLAHAFCAVLVFVILQRLVGVRWAAWLGALLFAVHPIQVEAVAWASSLYTPLSALFSLIAIWQFMSFTDSREAQVRGAWRHYVLATIAFLLALLTKPAVVTVPLVAAAIEVGLRHRPWRMVLAPLIAWLVMSFAIIWLTHRTLPAANLGAYQPWQRLVVAVDAIAFYMWKLVWPVRLVPDYGRSPRWLLDRPILWLSCLAPIALFVACRVLWRRVRGPAVALSIFVIGLLPTLGLVPFDYQVYSTAADRYAYLAMLGAALAAAMLLAHCSGKAPRVFAGVLLVVLAALSIVQLRWWQNSCTLFARTLRLNPGSKAAINAWRYMLLLHPDTQEPACTLPGQSLVDVGDLLAQEHRSELAAAAFRLALTRGEDGPQTFDHLAAALLQSDRLDEAAEACRAALRRRGDDPEARDMLQQIRRRTAATAPHRTP